jgi:hypothetical protein
MRIQVLGYNWDVFLVSPEEFQELHGQCNAVTLVDKKQIYFRTDQCDYLHVAHELTHAYHYYMCVDEILLNKDDSEEFICDFVAIHGETIHRQALSVMDELSKIHDLNIPF